MGNLLLLDGAMRVPFKVPVLVTSVCGMAVNCACVEAVANIIKSKREVRIFGVKVGNADGPLKDAFKKSIWWFSFKKLLASKPYTVPKEKYFCPDKKLV